MNNPPFLKFGAFFVAALSVFLSLPIDKSSFLVSASSVGERPKFLDAQRRRPEASPPWSAQNLGQTPSVAPPPDLKVAFVGDTGNGTNFQGVLQLIKDEGADIVLHQGDFDYSGDPDAFFATIDSILGPDFPYLASVGNHDDGSWNTGCGNPLGCYAEHLIDRMNALAIAPDEPDLNDQKYAIEYQGLKVVFAGENGNNTEFAQFISDQLTDDPHIWKICSWHRNQTAMQVGSKADDMSWDPYENCRRWGAIIATGHEHSYHRTRTLVNTPTQLVDPTCSEPNALCVGTGRTFVFVSGLGGRDIRNQDRCLPTTFPYGCNQEWANIYTSDQAAEYGALFITFNVDGDPRQAHGYFKNINHEIIDEFDITAIPPGEFTIWLPLILRSQGAY